jgi:rSAM/selenodomain-associated transferase 2
LPPTRPAHAREYASEKVKTLSVIVPMLNEERAIAPTLDAIAAGASGAEVIVEVIVVDGGSSDRSRDVARPRCARLLVAPRGLARQMNAGAATAEGDALAFVHADTLVPPTFARDIAVALADPAVVGGRFDLRLDDDAPMLRLIGWLISVRSRLSRTGTGDQAIFVRREVFERLGGYRDIALCEDLDLARRLKRAGRVACLRSQVTASARQWRERGVFATTARMWFIRIAFLLGVSPSRLAHLYNRGGPVENEGEGSISG